MFSLCSLPLPQTIQRLQLVLAFYYTIADAILILQVYYYRHKTRKAQEHDDLHTPTERSPLLSAESDGTSCRDAENLPKLDDQESRIDSRSSWIRGLLQNLVIIVAIVVIGFVAFFINEWRTQSTGSPPASSHPPHHHHHHTKPIKHPADMDEDQELIWWPQLLGYGSAVLYRAF